MATAYNFLKFYKPSFPENAVKVVPIFILFFFFLPSKHHLPFHKFIHESNRILSCKAFRGRPISRQKSSMCRTG